MELHYDQGIVALQSGGYRDGTISVLLWRSQRDTLTRGYGFRYDALNRLQRAYYAADDGSGRERRCCEKPAAERLPR